MHRLARSKIGARGLSKILIKYIKIYGAVRYGWYICFPWISLVRTNYQTVAPNCTDNKHPEAVLKHRSQALSSPSWRGR